MSGQAIPSWRSRNSQRFHLSNHNQLRQLDWKLSEANWAPWRKSSSNLWDGNFWLVNIVATFLHRTKKKQIVHIDTFCTQKQTNNELATSSWNQSQILILSILCTSKHCHSFFGYFLSLTFLVCLFFLRFSLLLSTSINLCMFSHCSHFSTWKHVQ